jgi:hypothetical protein
MAKGKKRPMTMKEFEGTKADRAADRKALARVNAKRTGK